MVGWGSTPLRWATLLMNGQRSEIRENGWIEIEDQALETGPNEVETPFRVNGASHGADGRFLSGKSPASVSSILSDDESATVRRHVLDIVSRRSSHDEMAIEEAPHPP